MTEHAARAARPGKHPLHRLDELRGVTPRRLPPRPTTAHTATRTSGRGCAGDGDPYRILYSTRTRTGGSSGPHTRSYRTGALAHLAAGNHPQLTGGAPLEALILQRHTPTGWTTVLHKTR